MKPYGAPIEPMNAGKPIIAPTENSWESGVTFNATAVYVARSVKNDFIIKKTASYR